MIFVLDEVRETKISAELGMSPTYTYIFTGISCFSMVHFTPLRFYERPLLLLVFMKRMKSKEGIAFIWQKAKIDSSLYTISAYEKFKRKVPLSDSGGDLYL